MTMPERYPLNPLTMPLQGLHVIEASAGTGKTWTLAALYVRLVLGHLPGNAHLGEGLYPPQILVMTFTDAATAELRGRIRERLSQAARFFGVADEASALADDFLRTLRAEIAPGQWPNCAYRLDMAAQWMDDAAIFTIHGWSSRMLKSHAFDSASLFEQSRVEDSDRLKLTAVQDYWRKWFYPATLAQLGALKPAGKTPGDLLELLKKRWALAEKAPAEIRFEGDTPDQTLRQWEAWQGTRQVLEALARSAWTPDIVALVNDAATKKLVKNYQARWLTPWLAQMAEWVQGGVIDPEILLRFSTTTLQEKSWQQAGNYIAFAHIEALYTHLGQEPDVATALLDHAAFEVGKAYRKAKAQLAQFDFSDLLQNLYHALQAPDGRLAAAIRQQFPMALVDEFQDTDPWQYGALSRIYAGPDSLGTGLVMIGDPKQAIYSFRGADLGTYLIARDQAQAIYTLSGNFRSTAGVVAAVNHVFARAEPRKPFGDVPFEPVQARNPHVLPLQVDGHAQAAMTVWHLQCAKVPNKAAVTQQMANVFATQIVALLGKGAAQPGQMAVLVRSGSEARAVREALSARGVRSVYLSERDSVFATPEAQDLWRILRAVANPRSTAWVRAALATRLWGLAWTELEVQLHDEQAWDELVEQFHGWQSIWQRQGFLPMLHRLLHDQSIPSRLLNHADADNHTGERRLTNLLHLGDLLQAASVGLQGEGALIRHLEAQLRHPEASGDAAQLRLESDANLVQVVTMHKAKGLQYPLVFLPFVSLYRAEKADDDHGDALRLAEDIRLLYVALTRAEQALWVGVSPVSGDMEGATRRAKSAVSWLLDRQAVGDLPERLRGWQCDDIVVQPAPPPDATRYIPPQAAKAWRAPQTPQRLLASRWWTASFSALTRNTSQPPADSAMPYVAESERDERLGDSQIDSAATTEDQATAPGESQVTALVPFNEFKAGSRYGTLLHDLLEWQARRGWPAGAEASAAPAASVVAEWSGLLARKARGLGLDDAQQALLQTWIGAITTTGLPLHTGGGLPSPLVLGTLPRAKAWPEMAFTLPVRQLAATRLDALIQAHVQPGQARPALLPQQLEGMLTGIMDLALEHDGRYYVLDYKSNRLAAYGPAQLQQAILAHRYDVQYTLYLLALHRLLKSRLAGYDYDQHVGGALHLFLRGIDQPGAGLYADLPPKALIESLDQAFAESANSPSNTDGKAEPEAA